jgi:hypothetical protein
MLGSGCPTITPERSNPHECHRERDDLQARPLPRKRVRSLATGRRLSLRCPARPPSGAIRPSSHERLLSRGFGGFTLSSRRGGQVAWKAVPDPEPTYRR